MQPSETFMAQYNGILTRTPLERSKSKIYTPKRDYEHPFPVHMWAPPPTPRCWWCYKTGQFSCDGIGCMTHVHGFLTVSAGHYISLIEFQLLS